MNITDLKNRFDYRLVLPVTGLIIIGLLAVYSATLDARAASAFEKQLFYVGVGLVVLVFMSMIPFRVLQLVSFPAYFLSIAMLVAVLLIGRTVSGSTSWFTIERFRLQPSEFTKITTIMALAAYVSRSDVSLKRFSHLATATGIVALPTVLILLQPDAGTTFIYFGFYFPLLYWGGASRFTLVAILSPIAAAFGALFGPTPFFVAIAVSGILLYVTSEHRIVTAAVYSLTVLVGISTQFIYEGLKPYQQKRIATFLNPGADPLGAGYNILQSKVAIGSGGLFGKGFLHGSQTQLNFIPEQWTDFIFCVPGEEFGFIGAATVLICFGLIFARGIGIASSVKNLYASFVAIGITGVLASHMIINIGMSVGLLPVIGVPLPLLSYGGSVMLSSMIMIGLLLNLHANRKEY
jgi:rod shape determining protein RodA